MPLLAFSGVSCKMNKSDESKKHERRRCMKKLKDKWKEFIFPVHWMLPVIFTFAFNNIIYFGVRIFTEGKYHYDFTAPVDELVPFIPQFIVVYFGCYILWVVNYCIIAKQDKERRYRFFTADFYARIVCMLCFLLLPTTNIRPILDGSDIWTDAVRFLYSIDPASNLLPSIHCMASWFCYVGIRGNKKIPLWYRRFTGIAALVVFYSTLALRQHVIVDVAAGVALAEITYFVSCHTNGYRIYMKIFERGGDRLMGLIRGKAHGKQEENAV